MTRVKTTDAKAALATLVGENVSRAAAGNKLVAKHEEPALQDYARERAGLMRAEGGKGTRVEVDALVGRVLADADVVWSTHNPASNPASARYLSKAEIEAIAKESPPLGALTRAAYQRVRGGGAAEAARAAVQSFFSTYVFAPDEVTGQRPLAAGLPGAVVLNGFDPAVRAGLPAGVRQAFDLYGKLQTGDIGNANLQRAQIGGHDVYVLYATTDGDPAFLEVFDPSGKPITSARINADTIIGFDEVFGRSRFHPTIVHVDGLLTEEGLSEPEEQDAQGQPRSDWPGLLRTSQGQLHYDAGQGYRLTQVELPIAKDDPRFEVAVAAFEYLFESSLKYRIIGTEEPFRLGAQREGELVLGPFTRPDGKTYEVAKWRDIDDGSFTLYFERTPDGRLRLHTSQFDN